MEALPVIDLQYLRQHKMTQLSQSMLQFVARFPQTKGLGEPSLEMLSDGVAFALMLTDADPCLVSLEDIEQGKVKWIGRVSNLKKILLKMQDYLEEKGDKTDHFRDIDVVQIAKHHSQEHILKLFAVVVGILMVCPHNQRYVQMIMQLPEESQNSFMQIIQKTKRHENTPSTIRNSQSSHLQIEQDLRQARCENLQLRGEVNELLRKNKSLQREVKDLKQKLYMYQEQIQHKQITDNVASSDTLQSQVDKQRLLIDNLKIKLISTVRQNQIQISELREQVATLRTKTKSLQEIETNLEQYKELYLVGQRQLQRMAVLERQKRRLQRQLSEKQSMIRRMQEQIQSKIEQVNAIRDKQTKGQPPLDKNIKRLKSQPSQFVINLDQQDGQIAYLQQQVVRLKNALKQQQKQNIKCRKRMEKIGLLEADKKKLERMLSQVNRTKDSQIQMLVISLYELRSQNIRIFHMLKERQEH